MWGFGNSAGLVQMHSFAEAKNKWDNTTPIRGRSKDCKPLGRNRRYNDRTIQKHWRVVEDGCLGQYVESYTANLWGTDYIEWFSDGRVFVKTGGYSSPTTNSTINYSIADAYGELYSFNGKPYFKTKDGKSYRMTSAGLMLEPTGEEIHSKHPYIAKVMRPLNPFQEYKYRANRKEMNKIRKHYQKFIDYGKAMYSITDMIAEKKDNKQGWYHYQFTYSKWQNDAMVQNRGRVFKLIDEFIDTDNLEIAYKAAIEIGHGFGWNNTCSAEQFADGVTEILKYRFKDSVFHKEAIPIGEAFYDRNAKYFYDARFTY
jgi:hypothetical protein